MTSQTHWKFNTHFYIDSGEKFYSKGSLKKAGSPSNKVALSATDFLDLTPLTGVVKEGVIPIFEEGSQIMEREAKKKAKVLTGAIRDSIVGYAFVSKKGNKVCAAVKSKSGDGLWLEIGVNHSRGSARKRTNRLRTNRKIGTSWADFSGIGTRKAKTRARMITDALMNVSTQEAQPYLRPGRDKGVEFITREMEGMF